MPIILLFCFIQGFTEFLPISSQGHLIVFNNFFPITDFTNLSIHELTIIAHSGSLLAIMIFYSQLILGLIRSFRFLDRPDIDKNSYLLINLFISTLPIVIIGYLFSKFFDYHNNHIMLIIALSSIIFGILLLLADGFSLRIKGSNSLNYRMSFYIGLFQCTSLIPGVSRSGSVLTLMRFLGFQRRFSVFYSNILSMPVIFAATTYLAIKNMDVLIFSNFLHLSSLSIFFFSFIFSYLFILFFVSWVKRFSFLIFILYRFAFGLGILLFFY